MKNIVKLLIGMIMILCITDLTSMRCYAALNPVERSEVYGIARSEAERLYNERIYSIMGDGVGPMTPGAYNWANIRADEVRNQLNARIDALGKVASSQEITDLNDKVDGTNSKLDENTSKVDKVQKTLDDINENSKKSSDGSTVSGVQKAVGLWIGAVNKTWEAIGAIFLGASFGENIGILEFFGFEVNINMYSGTTVYTVMETLAYSLVLLFFSVNMVETAVKYESISLKGFVTMAIRIVISKELIDNSPKICNAIIGVVRDTIGEMWTAKTESIKDLMDDKMISGLIADAVGNGNIPFIGEIVDAILAIIYAVPMTLLSLAAFVVGALILVRMLLWSVDMIILITVSPAFVACWSSDVTKQYCKNFIVTFIQASLQLLYMAIVFFIFKTFLSSTVPDSDEKDILIYVLKFIPNLLVMIAMAIMMIKPPKFLTNMLR